MEIRSANAEDGIAGQGISRLSGFAFKVAKA